MNKPKMALTALLALGTVLLGAGSIYAAGTTAAKAPWGDLPRAIADHFQLNVDEVRQVFAEERQNMMAQRQESMAQHHEEMLSNAVKNGKLTREQADALRAKEQEMQTFRQSLKDLSPADRQVALQKQRKKFKRWAQDNGLTQPMKHGFGHHEFFHGDFLPSQAQ